jgi:outer membrane protein TolC
MYVIHDLKVSYYEYSYLAHLIKIIEENVGLLKSLEDTAYVQYNTATAPYSDVIKVQVKLSKLSDDLITARECRITVAAKINQLLSLPPKNPLGTTREEKLQDVNLSIEKLTELGLSNQQELKYRKQTLLLLLQKRNSILTLPQGTVTLKMMREILRVLLKIVLHFLSAPFQNPFSGSG